MLIKRENVRCADRTILVCNVLGLVAQVRKVESLLSRSLNHFFETILWVIVVIVAIDRDEGDSPWGIVVLEFHHSILVIANVGTVIATEDNYDALSVGEVFETIRLAVDTFQTEIYCRTF